MRSSLTGQTRDISPIGICLELDKRLRKGTVMALSIHRMDRREKFSAVGRVVWTKRAEMKGHYLTGLRFTVVNEEGVVVEDQAAVQTFIREMERLPLEEPPAA